MLARAERLQREVFNVPGPSRHPGVAWEPPVDVLETDAAVLVLVALPGVAPDQVQLAIRNGVLLIAGERVLPRELRTAVIHRIELPQGGVIRGTPQDVGTWPTAVSSQPPNRRVLQLSDKGAGAVLADNSTEINAQLAAYNNSVMTGVPMPAVDPNTPQPSLGNDVVIREDNGCALAVMPPTRTRLMGWGSVLLLALAGLRLRSARRLRS